MDERYHKFRSLGQTSEGGKELTPSISHIKTQDLQELKKVTQQLDRNPTHFPEAVNLHIPCTHFVTVLPLWAVKNQHAAHHEIMQQLEGSREILVHSNSLHTTSSGYRLPARCHVSPVSIKQMGGQTLPKAGKTWSPVFYLLKQKRVFSLNCTHLHREKE